jgi:hypothetical protein
MSEEQEIEQDAPRLEELSNRAIGVQTKRK